MYTSLWNLNYPEKGQQDQFISELLPHIIPIYPIDAKIRFRSIEPNSQDQLSITLINPKGKDHSKLRVSVSGAYILDYLEGDDILKKQIILDMTHKLRKHFDDTQSGNNVGQLQIKSLTVMTA